MRNILVGAAALAGIALAGPADAASITYHATLTPLNGSGVNGTAQLVLDSVANTLSVHIQASGMEPNMVHPQHIHGRFDHNVPGPGTGGMLLDSSVPTLAQDTDHDGFIELDEGHATYGHVIVSLTSPPGGALSGFPVAAADGTIDFTQLYDLTDPTTFAGGFNVNDLLPLDLREIVLHGMSVPAGVGAGTPGEVDGTAGYKAVLPVAAGEIAVVPLPAAGWMLLSAIAGLGAFGRNSARRRAA
jgi:hypothetical protein